MNISVVIPVFNGEKYLGEAIESVLNQTHSDLELVLVNDGSTDSTLQIMERYATQDKRVRIISQANQGRCEAFNRGLAEAKYTWVARLDADDVFLPRKISTQVAFLEKNRKVRILGTQGYHIDQIGRRLSLMGMDGPFTETEFEQYLKSNKPIFFIASSTLMHRKTVLDLGGLRREVHQAEDLDLWNRVSEKGNLVLKIPEPLVLYRVHEESVSASKYIEQRLYYKWVRDCMHARRSGIREPTLKEYVETRRKRPWHKRINSFRKDHGKYCYRMAALNYANRNYVGLLGCFLASGFIHPEHAVPRFIKQFLLPLLNRP